MLDVLRDWRFRPQSYAIVALYSNIIVKIAILIDELANVVFVIHAFRCRSSGLGNKDALLIVIYNENYDMEQEFSSPLLEAAVTSLSRLPGVGRKTALRFALHLLRRDEADAVGIGQAIIDLRKGIRYCKICHNISEDDVCPLCASPVRNRSTVCVVESVRDVMSIENTGQYFGLYHVLGGLISPVDGIGPDRLQIASLVERVEAGGVDEVILATGATVEADTTNFYIARLLSRSSKPVKVTQLARGVAVGNEIEYTDEVTLARSLQNRTLFEI